MLQPPCQPRPSRKSLAGLPIPRPGRPLGASATCILQGPRSPGRRLHDRSPPPARRCRLGSHQRCWHARATSSSRLRNWSNRIVRHCRSRTSARCAFAASQADGTVDRDDSPPRTLPDGDDDCDRDRAPTLFAAACGGGAGSGTMLRDQAIRAPLAQGADWKLTSPRPLTHLNKVGGATALSWSADAQASSIMAVSRHSVRMGGTPVTGAPAFGNGTMETVGKRRPSASENGVTVAHPRRRRSRRTPSMPRPPRIPSIGPSANGALPANYPA